MIASSASAFEINPNPLVYGLYCLSRPGVFFPFLFVGFGLLCFASSEQAPIPL